MTEVTNKRKGYQLSAETKARMSAASKRFAEANPEFAKKRAGLIHTPEAVSKKNESMRSEETRKRCSDAKYLLFEKHPEILAAYAAQINTPESRLNLQKVRETSEYGKQMSDSLKDSYRNPNRARNPNNPRYVTGTFQSTKMGQVVHFRSSLERDFFIGLENALNVIEYFVEPFGIDYSLDGVEHVYIPDVLVSFVDGVNVLVEVKPQFLWNDRTNVAKFEYATKYCNERGWSFVVTDNVQIPLDMAISSQAYSIEYSYLNAKAQRLVGEAIQANNPTTSPQALVT